jgi:uroporphyrinogen-III synthase
MLQTNSIILRELALLLSKETLNVFSELHIHYGTPLLARGHSTANFLLQMINLMNSYIIADSDSIGILKENDSR